MHGKTTLVSDTSPKTNARYFELSEDELRQKADAD
jgi:hypothetical protein